MTFLRFCGTAPRIFELTRAENPRFFSPPLEDATFHTALHIHYDGSDHETIGSCGSIQGGNYFLPLATLISRSKKKKKKLEDRSLENNLLKQISLDIGTRCFNESFENPSSWFQSRKILRKFLRKKQRIDDIGEKSRCIGKKREIWEKSSERKNL